jgi:hypothetical protein
MTRLMRTAASSAELPLVDLPSLQPKRTAALRNLLMLLRISSEGPLPALSGLVCFRPITDIRALMAMLQCKSTMQSLVYCAAFKRDEVRLYGQRPQLLRLQCSSSNPIVPAVPGMFRCSLKQNRNQSIKSAMKLPHIREPLMSSGAMTRFHSRLAKQEKNTNLGTRRFFYHENEPTLPPHHARRTRHPF